MLYKDDGFIFLCLLLLFNPEHNVECLIGFLDPNHTGLACLITFLGCFVNNIAHIGYFMSAILNGQNDSFAGVCANANIHF